MRSHLCSRRSLALSFSLLVPVLLAGCGEEPPGSPTQPEDAPPAEQARADQDGQENQGDHADIEGEINRLIADLFPAGQKTQRANEAFADVKGALARSDTATARSEMFDFVDLLLDEARAGNLQDPERDELGNAREGAVELTRLYFQLVGLEAPALTAGALEETGAADVVGDEGGTVATGDGKASLEVPAGEFDGPAMVTVDRRKDPATPDEAPTEPSLTLAPHGPFYDVEATTEPTGSGGLAVGICVPTTGPLAASPEVHDDLRVVRKTSSGETELLPLAPATSVSCEENEIAVAGATTGFSVFGGGSSPEAVDSKAGGFSSCALREDGQTYCWGRNDAGQLGDSTTNSSLTPVAVQQSTDFEEIAGKFRSTCGLDSNGQAYCWGSNRFGQLGVGTGSESLAKRTVPTAVEQDVAFTEIVGGANHYCGLDQYGQAHCWGVNGFGQLGDGTTDNAFTPVQVSGGHSFVQLSAGAWHTCGVTGSDQAYCWGWNRWGQLGTGDKVDQHTPAAVDQGGLSFTKTAVVYFASCGLDSNGQAHCWGANVRGLLGNDSPETFVTETSPDSVAQNGVTFEDLRGGRQHFCGLDDQSQAHCWGYNGFGQVGDGTTTRRRKPVPVDQAVDGGIDLRTVAPGGRFHSCATTDTTQTGGGEVYCWGLNDEGQLGDGTTTTRLSPVKVGG